MRDREAHRDRSEWTPFDPAGRRPFYPPGHRQLRLLKGAMIVVYEVRVTGREGRWWAVEIPELNGVTQAARLADVPDEARSYIAVALDVPISSVDVRVRISDTPHARNVQERSQRILAARKEARALEDEAMQQAQALAKELAGDGIPMRDIATLVGVSFQRVSQLAAAG
nr:hypothetical protein [Mycobacterium marinum]